MDDATSEEWRAVVGYEGLYLASDLGRVRSLPRNTTSGRILKQRADDVGRLEVKLSKDGVEKTRRVHQLVAEAFIGECPPGQEVRHLDDDPSNNRRINLAYGTSKQNKADMLRNHGHYKNAITECPQGHEYTEENTYIGPKGRECRKCHNERSRERSRAMAVPGAGTECTIDGCEFGQIGKGLCKRHYDEKWKAENAEAVREYQRRSNARRVPSGPPCPEPGCGEPSSAKGLCPRHYGIAYRTERKRREIA